MFILACLTLAPSSGSATEPTAPHESEVECYDAEVSARIVAQVPTIPPEFDDRSIVMRWPWFIDLDVRKVRIGQVPIGIISTLAVQHTYWRKDLGATRWHMRRNSQGGFNLLGLAKGEGRPRCASDAPPAQTFLSTDDPAMLDTLRREGEARYGRRK